VGELAAIQQIPGVAVRVRPGLGWTGLVLNTRADPFRTAAARRAVSYALDRRELLRRSGAGAGVLATPVSAALAWAHDPDPRYLTRDPDRARQELAAAGAPAGFRFELQVARDTASLRQLAEGVRDQLAGIGVGVAIRYLDFAALPANGGAGAFQALVLGWSGGLDPSGLAALFATGAGANYALYSNPQVDRLLAAARETADRTQRAAAYRQVQQLLFEDQPVVVLAQAGQATVARTSVQNYPQTYNGFGGARDFDAVWKT
jgi:peptide/nickel transport system substrate-binding protein